MTRAAAPPRRHFAQRVRRRVLFELRYLALVWHTFRGSLLFIGVILAFATLIIHEGYPPPHGEPRVGWDRVAYNVLIMTAFGSGLAYNPQAPPLVNAMFFVLPVLGLSVVVGAVARFSGLLFQRRPSQKEYQELMASTYNDHVVVGGLGHVGVRIVEQLVRGGTEVVVIEASVTPFIDEIRALGVPVLAGDIRKAEMLRKARVESARAIIAATDNDLVNIETCLNAREISPTIKVILRIFDQSLAKKLEKLVDVDYAFSTSALAAPLFAAAATTRNVINSFVVEDTVLNTVELTVAADSRLVGRTLDSLRGELEVTFLLVQTGTGMDWNPALAHTLDAGHKLWIVTTTDALQALEAMNQSKRLFPKW